MDDSRRGSLCDRPSKWTEFRRRFSQMEFLSKPRPLALDQSRWHFVPFAAVAPPAEQSPDLALRAKRMRQLVVWERVLALRRWQNFRTWTAWTRPSATGPLSRTDPWGKLVCVSPSDRGHTLRWMQEIGVTRLRVDPSVVHQAGWIVDRVIAESAAERRGLNRRFPTEDTLPLIAIAALWIAAKSVDDFHPTVKKIQHAIQSHPPYYYVDAWVLNKTESQIVSIVLDFDVVSATAAQFLQEFIAYGCFRVTFSRKDSVEDHSVEKQRKERVAWCEADAWTRLDALVLDASCAMTFVSPEEVAKFVVLETRNAARVHWKNGHAGAPE